MASMIPYAQYKRLPKAAKDALARVVAKDGRRSRTAPRARAPRLVSRLRSLAGAASSVGAAAEPGSWPARALSMVEQATPLALAGLRLAGFGDYSMPSFSPESNSLMAAITSHGPPALSSTRSRSHIIRHREYIGDVITAATPAFTVQQYPINPGMQQTFPWLYGIASCFEQYRINGMVFEFKSTSADALNSTNTALGTVIMATEYNADASGFTSKQQMENHEFASSCRQSTSALHPIECKKSLTPVSELYVRTSDPAAGQDLRLYDLGTFSIATVGQQGASVNIGELWVTYEIEFFKPQFPDLFAAQWTFMRGTAGISTSEYFGSDAALLHGDLGITVTSNQVVFPSTISNGNYLVTYIVSGVAATVASVNWTASGGHFEDVYNVADGLNYTYSAGTAVSRMIQQQVLSVSSAGPTITFSGGTLPSTPTGAYIQVVRLGDLD